MAKEVAAIMKRTKSIGFLVGAGISVSAGYPDFRSNGGLYSLITHLNLPYPEAIFDIVHFRRKPEDFFSAAKLLVREDLGPTPTHNFMRKVQEHGLLEVVVTQNIDGLERKAGIDEDKLIEIHGTNARSHCIDCKAEFDNKEMRRYLRDGKVARCTVCGGVAKPDVVFFHEPLLIDTRKLQSRVSHCDLFFIIGTSLQVYPAAGVYKFTPSDAVRIYINKEATSRFKPGPRDNVLLGDCDSICTSLARELGWDVS